MCRTKVCLNKPWFFIAGAGINAGTFFICYVPLVIRKSSIDNPSDERLPAAASCQPEAQSGICCRDAKKII